MAPVSVVPTAPGVSCGLGSTGSTAHAFVDNNATTASVTLALKRKHVSSLFMGLLNLIPLHLVPLRFTVTSFPKAKNLFSQEFGTWLSWGPRALGLAAARSSDEGRLSPHYRPLVLRPDGLKGMPDGAQV